MIRKMEVEDIARILTLKDDDFSELFYCELGEWVQFLIQHVGDESFFMWAGIEDDIMVGYLIAYFIPLPICKGVQVLYSKTAGIKTNKQVLEKLKEWSIKNGSGKIDIITNNVKGHSIYGFKKTGTTMTIKL